MLVFGFSIDYGVFSTDVHRHKGSKKEINAVLKEHNFEDTSGFSYGFKKKQSAKSKAMGMPAEYKYHLYGCKKAGTALDTVHVLVMQEVDNKITEVKEYVRR